MWPNRIHKTQILNIYCRQQDQKQPLSDLKYFHDDMIEEYVTHED